MIPITSRVSSFEDFWRRAQAALKQRTPGFQFAHERKSKLYNSSSSTAYSSAAVIRRSNSSSVVGPCTNS